MKKLLTTLVLLAACAYSYCATYDIRALGADPTGRKPCTDIINNAIIKTSGQGGGTICIPAGEYLTAAIKLHSNITVCIESGAVLRFSDRFEDYLPMVQVRWEGVTMNSFCPLFHAADAENITICGRGKIDGQGAKWWAEANRLIDLIKKDGSTGEPNELQKIWIKENLGIKVDPYYEKTLERKFFRPPFIQFFRCKNIRIEGITIINSPFWTVNPEFCDNVTVHGITIDNPLSPNTDGINPSSCSNVHISDCHINVGDDCITIKSGRDADGRKWGKPCENITITNCTMLAGHGGVVIGSEMSGGVRRVTISNCVFHGTEAGIRLKSSRGRGGIVEQIRVDNIVMEDIQRSAFIFDLFYDKDSQPEPVSERTPVFRNIHISNVTGKDIKKVGYIAGIAEMPIEEISFSNINMVAGEGFTADLGVNLRFRNVDFAVQKGPSFAFTNCRDVVLDDVRSKAPLAGQPVVEIKGCKNVFINNCFPIVPTDVFCKADGGIICGHNFLDNVKNK